MLDFDKLFFVTCCQNFWSRDDTMFCGVFDGHGPYGHLVAKRVRDLLPIELGADLGTDEARETSASNIKNNANEVGSQKHIDKGDTTISSEAEQNGEYPGSFRALRTAFLKAFHIMDRDLKLHKNIDCLFSGTTAVAVIKQVAELDSISDHACFRDILSWFHQFMHISCMPIN
jgi:serine/threonine protein phosphatase PrpC